MEKHKAQANRGSATKNKLLKAAIDIFARDGYHAASTRDIASNAGVNQALIGYHFGGKENLYLAAMEYIADQIRLRMSPVADSIFQSLDQVNTKEGYLDLLHQFTDAFVVMLVDKKASSWAGLILREQQMPSPAFDLLYQGLMQKLLSLTTHLVSKICDIDELSEQARLLSLTLFGQAVVFRASRTAVLQYMQWNDITGEEIALIQQQIRSNISQILFTGDV